MNSSYFIQDRPNICVFQRVWVLITWCLWTAPQKQIGFGISQDGRYGVPSYNQKTPTHVRHPWFIENGRQHVLNATGCELCIQFRCNRFIENGRPIKQHVFFLKCTFMAVSDLSAAWEQVATVWSQHLNLIGAVTVAFFEDPRPPTSFKQSPY